MTLLGLIGVVSGKRLGQFVNDNGFFLGACFVNDFEKNIWLLFSMAPTGKKLERSEIFDLL